jgi:transcriptional regulator with GAF, ATPase, and Fis domain
LRNERIGCIERGGLQGYARCLCELSVSLLKEIQRRHIVEVLKRTGWKIAGADGAARLLKVNPSTMRSRIRKLGNSSTNS